MAINNLLNARRGRRHEPPPPLQEQHVSRWPAILALLALGGLYAALPPRMTVGGPRWLLLALEIPVLLFLVVVRHVDVDLRISPHAVRVIAVALLSLATLLIAVSVETLIATLVAGKGLSGGDLLRSAAGLWSANVVIFALWYWELDRGGPQRRRQPDHPSPDLLFPQQSGPDVGPPGWSPSFIDYLFVAFTTATAFSPTDTLPLSGRVKVLMMVEALGSLLMVGVLAARAVNILH
jgi:hypothetical protein